MQAQSKELNVDWLKSEKSHDQKNKSLIIDQASCLGFTCIFSFCANNEIMRKYPLCYGKHADGNHPPWPGTVVTICVSYFMTGEPSKELTSHHQLEEFRKGQKEMPRVLPPPRILLADIHLG